jgi:hypothetical protein
VTVVLRNMVVSSPTTVVQMAGQAAPPPFLEMRDADMVSRAELVYRVKSSRASKKVSPLAMEANAMSKVLAFMMIL